ncbi:MAG: fumarate/nitrate reduction transcriptional regulator Fnr [Porticoccaceae bacterium]|jgi:CRP/FNR family transcriptional regulator, anaerobic regulatory protein|nr:fumarate/nitrate reduction transcriptional regulator Fnr [Porticoccaceae bacterium]
MSSTYGERIPVTKGPQCRHSPSTSCGDCRLSGICLPIALQEEEVARLEDIVNRGKPVQKSHTVYHQEQEFSAVYAVRVGCIKTVRTTQDGKEQVTGFYFPGEIFGMDGISNNRHTNSAIALETSAVCEIPFDRLQELSSTLPSLQKHFFQLMSSEIAADQQLITQLSKNSAEERMAALFLSVSTRFSARNQSGVRFRLPMSRGDISNYLGLTVETVSRILSRLQSAEIISVDNKEVEILDFEQLRQIAAVA